MKKHILAALLAIGLLSPFLGTSMACDYCLLSQGISPLETVKGSGIKINERYTRLTKPYKGTERLHLDAGAKEEYWTTEVTGFYGVTEDLTVLGVVPIRRTKVDGHLHVLPDGTPEVHTDVTGTEFGLGDIALIGRYSFFKKHTLDSTTTIAGLFGVKFPTGKTSGKTDDGAEFLDAHQQLGTGSTDFILGLSANCARERLAFSANLLGTITTVGRAGDKTHRFGDMLNYDLTARYRVYPVSVAEGPQVFAALGLNGELRQREKEDNVEVADSGGHTVYLSPGVQVTAGRHWVFELTYQQAVYHNLYGTQLGEDYKASGGVTYLF